MWSGTPEYVYVLLIIIIFVGYITQSGPLELVMFICIQIMPVCGRVHPSTYH